MVDPRIEKLASVLVHYSLQIRRNDLFRIAGPSLATPLIRAVYAEALAAGANPYVRVSLEGLEELFYRKATDEQLRFVSDWTARRSSRWTRRWASAAGGIRAILPGC